MGFNGIAKSQVMPNTYLLKVWLDQFIFWAVHFSSRLIRETNHQNFPHTFTLLDSMVASFVLKFPRGVLWYWIGIGIGYWIWLWSWWCGGVWPAFLKNGTKIWQRCIKLCASPIPNSNLRLPIPIFYGIDIHAEWTKTQSNTLFRFWRGIKINILAAAMGQPNT